MTVKEFIYAFSTDPEMEYLLSELSNLAYLQVLLQFDFDNKYKLSTEMVGAGTEEGLSLLIKNVSNRATRAAKVEDAVNDVYYAFRDSDPTRMDTKLDDTQAATLFSMFRLYIALLVIYDKLLQYLDQDGILANLGGEVAQNDAAYASLASASLRFRCKADPRVFLKALITIQDFDWTAPHNPEDLHLDLDLTALQNKEIMRSKNEDATAVNLPEVLITELMQINKQRVDG